MFKTADPSRRAPSWLQNGTKENIIWQLTMVLFFIAGSSVKDWYEYRQLKQSRNL